MDHPLRFRRIAEAQHGIPSDAALVIEALTLPPSMLNFKPRASKSSCGLVVGSCDFTLSGFYVLVCNMEAKSSAKQSAKTTTSRRQVLQAEF